MSSHRNIAVGETLLPSVRLSSLFLVSAIMQLNVYGQMYQSPYTPVRQNGSVYNGYPPQFLCPPDFYGPPGRSNYPVSPGWPHYLPPPTTQPLAPSRAPLSPAPSDQSPSGQNGQSPAEDSSGRTESQSNSPSAAPSSQQQQPSQQSVQNALSQSQQNDASSVIQAALQNEMGGQGSDQFAAAGYGRGAQMAPNSIGDFFGSRLQARTALLRIPGQNYLFYSKSQQAGFTDYFRQVDLTGPFMETGVLLPGVDGTIVTGAVTQRLTGDRIFGDINVHQADRLILTDDPAVTFDGDTSQLGTLTTTDSGPFSVRTVDVLPGLHPDSLGTLPQTATFTEDSNGNGILDVGEDFNGNGLLDSEVQATEAEVFGLYRELIVLNPGDLVGRSKIAENTSAVPRDRLIFDYTFYQNVGLNSSGRDVHRYAPGFEKTLFGGIASVDVRFPFASTLQSVLTTSNSIGTAATTGGLTNSGDVHMGDISLIAKVLLGKNPDLAVSTGAQVTLPTASDIRVQLDDSLNTEVLRIENQSVHVMPFLAALHTPNERTFVNYFAQYDHDSTGSTIHYRGANAGRSRDVDFLYLDISAGYWIYSNPPQVRTTRNGRFIDTAIVGSHGITGFAPRLDLHYNRSLNSADVSAFGNDEIILGNNIGRLESFNMNLGATMMFGADRELTVAWGTPVINRNDSDFDNEIRILFNWILPN